MSRWRKLSRAKPSRSRLEPSNCDETRILPQDACTTFVPMRFVLSLNLSKSGVHGYSSGFARNSRKNTADTRLAKHFQATWANAWRRAIKDDHRVFSLSISKQVWNLFQAQWFNTLDCLTIQVLRKFSFIAKIVKSIFFCSEAFDFVSNSLALDACKIKFIIKRIFHVKFPRTKRSLLTKKSAETLPAT